MAITVKHTKVSTIPDGDDTSVVRPSDWNADHQLVGTVPVANGGTGASTLTGYVKGNGTSTMTASSTIPNTDITGLGTASTKDAGIANGVATLDGSGTVPISQLPAAVIGALSYQGTWNATTNTPTLTSSVGTKGYYYVVSVAGSTNLNGITDWQVGDWAVYNGSAWQKIDNTDAVTSVNGYTGTVVLTQTDISGTVPTSRTITAGTGLSGGGDLSANRTLTIANTGVTATTYGSASSVPVVAVNAQGQITSATSTAIAIANTAVSGLGTMSTQNANSVAITGGTIDGTTIGGTTPAVITGSTINANTKVVSPDYYAQSVLGGNLRTYTGTSLLNWDGGGSGNVTINGGLLASPANKNVTLSPSGTGTVTINPATAGAMDNVVIGATTPKAITGTTVTATTFSGSGASLTSIPNSALVNSSITINGNATALGGSVSVGTVTSVAATAGTGITISGSPITTSGTLTITNSLPMVYPGAGIPNSTGTAWGTSYTTTGSGTVLALATNPTFVTPTLGAATGTSLALSISALTSSNTGNFSIGGTLSFSDTGITANEVGTTNGYLQSVIQNKSAGASASAEFIAYNDSGTASTNYATVGINSSGYTGTGSINAAGYGYFLTGSTDLVLGTVGNNGMHFVVNSSATDAMAISSAGAVTIASTLRVGTGVTGGIAGGTF
jgi:hypothetical protein